jgi:hypothetical protein
VAPRPRVPVLATARRRPPLLIERSRSSARTLAWSDHARRGPAREPATAWSQAHSQLQTHSQSHSQSQAAS